MLTLKKTVLITGGSRGIGKETSIEFAKNGYDVAVNCAHDEEALRSLHAQITELGCRCVMCMGDVGSAGDADRVMSAAQEGLGGIDILVNNAGISYICKPPIADVINTYTKIGFNSGKVM